MLQSGAAVRRPDGDVEWPVRRPDGDVELRDAGHGFHVPPCPQCGGTLKPDVVSALHVPRGPPCAGPRVPTPWPRRCSLVTACRKSARSSAPPALLTSRLRAARAGSGAPPCRALELVSTCEALLVVGSSCQVYSAFKLVKAAAAGGAAVAMLNVGPTRADALAARIIPALAGEALARLAAHPSLLLPRH